MGFPGKLFGEAINAAKRGINTIRSNVGFGAGNSVVETIAKPKPKISKIKATVGAAGIIGAGGAAYMMSKSEDTNYNKDDPRDEKIKELERL